MSEKTAMPTPSGVFTRASSGLVRQVKAQDVVWYGWQQIALSYLIFIVLAWSAYPGASMEWATVLATVGGVAMGICYALLAAVYPRSGGEYVFVSRIVHPAVGFVVSFSFTFWEVFYYGINGAFLAIYAASPFCGVLGVQLNSPGLLDASVWFGSHWGIFITGSVMVAIMAGLQATGLGRYFRWQRWASYLAAVSLLVTIVVLSLAATGALDFQSHFNQLAAAGEYQKIVAGTQLAGGSFSQTVKFMIWPAFSIWFAVASVSFSGEVKNVQRGQMIGINGAMISMGVAMLVLVYLYRAAFGSAFIIASSASKSYTLAAPPFVNVFTGIAGNNVALTIITFLWVLVIALFVGGTCLVYASRAMLAWSIDGVAPEWLGNVSERFAAPYWAIAICAVLAEIWLGFFSFTSLLGPISGFTGFTISFMVVPLTAVLFPFVKKEAFENSPVAWRIGRVPVISVIGVIALVFIGVGTARILVDHAYTPNLAFADVGALIVLAVATLIFYGMRWYRKREGTDIDQRYQEIPIE